jgi:hypothetical protein
MTSVTTWESIFLTPDLRPLVFSKQGLGKARLVAHLRTMRRDYDRAIEATFPAMDPQVGLLHAKGGLEREWPLEPKRLGITWHEIGVGLYDAGHLKLCFGFNAATRPFFTFHLGVRGHLAGHSHVCFLSDDFLDFFRI